MNYSNAEVNWILLDFPIWRARLSSNCSEAKFLDFASCFSFQPKIFFFEFIETYFAEFRYFFDGG